MPFADPEERREADRRTKRKRRLRDPEGVRAADNERKRLKRAEARREKEERTGEPAPERPISVGRERLSSNPYADAAIDVRVAQGWGQAVGVGIKVKVNRDRG